MTRRIERDPHDSDFDYWWTVKDGECVPIYKGREGTSRQWYGESVTPERVKLWASLLAQPDEPTE